MKEIDTEPPVVWPAWCYSANIPTDILKQKPAKATTAIVGGKTATPSATSKFALPSAAVTAAPTTKTTKRRHVEPAATDLSKQHSGGEASANVSAAAAALASKMLSERSLLLGSGFNTIESAKKACNSQSNSLATTITTTTLTTAKTSTTAAVAAAAYAAFYLEKVKNEKLSPLGVSSAQIDSLKDAIMETTALANNNNNNNSNNNNNNNITTTSNCNLTESNISNHQLQQQQQQAQHLSIGSNVKRERLSPGTNGEQHTTGTNTSTTYSRSRSVTPSSFHGVSPQQQRQQQQSPPSTSIPMHNLSTNLLNSIQNAATAVSFNAAAAGCAPHASLAATIAAGNQSGGGQVTSCATDFSARNYSDIMRSLAAKYNNTHPNDSNTARRNAFFDNPNTNAPSVGGAVNSNKSTTSTAAKKPGALASKDGTNVASVQQVPQGHSAMHSRSASPASAAPAALKSQSNQTNPIATAAAAAAAAAAVAASSTSVSPFMTTLLSSLPFSQGILPPLMDMSSTQALLTLARAAKEAEIQNILRTAQQQQQLKRPNSRSSTSAVATSANVSVGSPRPSLNAALQQAAQFVSPALIYAAQLQQQQQSQSQNSRQSSPHTTTNNNNNHNNNSNDTSRNDNANSDSSAASAAAPLDLSSQPPPAKRFKAESSTSSQCSVDGLRACPPSSRSTPSASTSTSPSPPPIETKFNINTITNANAHANATANINASTKTEVNCSTTQAGSSSPSPSTTKVNIRQCQAHSDEVNSWSVDAVCEFVGGIDICAEYVQHFRDQCIDGTGLPLLTEDHLVNSLGMKLGPALKLRSILARKLGGPCPCVACIAQAQNLLALQTAATNTIAPTTTSPPLITTTETSTISNTTATMPLKAATTTSAGLNAMPITMTDSSVAARTTQTTPATTQTTLATTATAQASGEDVICNGPNQRDEPIAATTNVGNFNLNSSGDSGAGIGAVTDTGSRKDSNSSSSNASTTNNISTSNINSSGSSNSNDKQNTNKDVTANVGNYNKKSAIYHIGDDLSCS